MFLTSIWIVHSRNGAQESHVLFSLSGNLRWQDKRVSFFFLVSVWLWRKRSCHLWQCFKLSFHCWSPCICSALDLLPIFVRAKVSPVEVSTQSFQRALNCCQGLPVKYVPHITYIILIILGKPDHEHSTAKQVGRATGYPLFKL